MFEKIFSNIVSQQMNPSRFSLINHSSLLPMIYIQKKSHGFMR